MPWWDTLLYAMALGAEAFAFVPLAVALPRLRHIPYAFRPMIFYTIGLLFIWYLGRYGRVYLHNNIFCFHLTSVLEIGFLSQTFYRLVPHPTFRRIVQIGYVIFLGFAFADAVFWHGFMQETNIYARSFGNLLVIVYALYYILLLTEQAVPAIEKRPDFLLCVSVLIFYSMPLLVTILLLYLERYKVYQFDFISLTPFILSAGVAAMFQALMFARFPLDRPPRQALPTWLRWRWRPRKAPVTVE